MRTGGGTLWKSGRLGGQDPGPMDIKGATAIHSNQILGETKVQRSGGDSMRRYTRKHFVGFAFAFLVMLSTSFLLPQVRLYVAAWAGSSDAMWQIADEYYRISYGGTYAGLFHHDAAKGDYWMRRSVQKGNLVAFQRIIQQWDYSNPHEVVYWLKHGCDLGIPWCAEELARGYWMGLYRLPQDYSRTGKAWEYDNLAVALHRKKGTLKDHACQFLPPPPPWPYPWDKPRPLTPEVHPGIPRESVIRK
jgi:hypothetical protein